MCLWKKKCWAGNSTAPCGLQAQARRGKRRPERIWNIQLIIGDSFELFNKWQGTGSVTHTHTQNYLWPLKGAVWNVTPPPRTRGKSNGFDALEEKNGTWLKIYTWLQERDYCVTRLRSFYTHGGETLEETHHGTSHTRLSRLCLIVYI